jgi:hypothetical protein
MVHWTHLSSQSWHILFCLSAWRDA